MCESLKIQSAEFSADYKDDKGRTYPHLNFKSVASTDSTQYAHARARIVKSIEQYHAFYTSEYKSPFTIQT